jgi:hypothetical protein
MSGADSLAPREEPVPPVEAHARRIRFDRNELSGAFGDIGTDLPLLVGMILAAGLNPCSVFVMFGAMQVLTGVTYGVPMPAQPLKAMATIVITQRLSGNVLYGGGLAIGLVMLVLVGLGLIDALARIIPRTVVRGIQFGLGLQLATLALREYLPAEGPIGYGLGALTFGLVVVLLGNRRFPPAPFAIAFGLAYALLLRLDPHRLVGGMGFTLPNLRVPSRATSGSGFSPWHCRRSRCPWATPSSRHVRSPRIFFLIAISPFERSV